VVVTAPRNYSSQKSYCSDVLSGALVSHSSREKQLLVGGTDRRCCCCHCCSRIWLCGQYASASADACEAHSSCNASLSYDPAAGCACLATAICSAVVPHDGSYLSVSLPALPCCPQVERYFRLQGSLPTVGYWWGGARPSSADPFDLADGTSVPQVGGQALL
jgi:hypothetical protein